jgi:hypothetical protein
MAYVKRRGQPRRPSADRGPLSPAWRFLLEHGLYPSDELIGPNDDRIDLYRSWGRGTRVAEPLWRIHRETILFDWAAAGRPGLPWAEWVFDLELDASQFYRLDEDAREQAAERRRRELKRPSGWTRPTCRRTRRSWRNA